MTMKTLISTMAGTVFTLNKAAGEEVVTGDVVLVLESMKMEIPVESDQSGKIAEIHVAEGDFVNEGDTLVTFE